MTNEERIAKITALEETLLSELDSSNCGEKMAHLLTCDNLYRAYLFRRIEEARDAAVPMSNVVVRETPQTPAETAAVETVTEETETSPKEGATEPEQDTAPTKDYMVKVLSHAANAKGVDVGACIASLGYKKLSDMPRDKYRELLKLAGCDE